MPFVWPLLALTLVASPPTSGVSTAGPVASPIQAPNLPAFAPSLFVADVRTVDGTVEITIANRGATVATAWVVEFAAPADGRPRGRASTDCYKATLLGDSPTPRTTPSHNPSGCPLAPDEQAVVRGSGRGETSEARVVGAIFEDGTSEGDVARLLAQREAEGRACDKWLAIIRATEATDDDVAVSLLRMKLDASRGLRDERIATELIEQLLIRVAEDRSFLRNSLKFIGDYLQRVQREATRHLSRSSR